MTTTFAHPTLTPDQPETGMDFKSLLLEPLLIAGSVAFWAVTLPFVALALACVKVSDTVKALASGQGARQNPLILRRGLAKGGVVRGTARPAQVH